MIFESPFKVPWKGNTNTNHKLHGVVYAFGAAQNGQRKDNHLLNQGPSWRNSLFEPVRERQIK